MRIISKVKDYYDCIQAQGQDLTCVWVRDMVTRPGGWRYPTCLPYGYFDHKIHFYHWVVGFCGKVYPCLQLFAETDVYATTATKSMCCYNAEKVSEFIENNYKEEVFDRFCTKQRTYGLRFSQKGVEGFFKRFTESDYNREELFIEHGTPVFVAKYDGRNSSITYHGCKKEYPELDEKLEDNPTLGQIEFFRAVDPYTAFQEIHMYLSGVLGNGNPPVPKVSNNDLIEAKGFDLKYSFRKEPTKK